MKKTNKIYAIIVAVIMLTSAFMTIFSNVSFAMNEVDIQQVPGNEPEERTFVVDFGTAQWNVNGVVVAAVSQWIPVLNEGPVEIGETDLIRVSNFNSNTMQIVLKGENNFQTKLSLVSNDETTLQSRDAANLPNGTLTFVVEAKSNNNNPENNQNNPPAQVGGPDNIEFDVAFTNTHMNIWINNKSVVEVQSSDPNTEYKGTIDGAGEANATKFNVLRFQENYGDLPVNEFTINGVKYTENSQEVEIREGEGWFITIPGAEKYTISGEADENAVVPRTIIWVNPDYVPKDAADADWVKQFTIEHGYARIIAAYGADGQLINPNDYIGQNSDEYGLNNGFGWATFFPGARVVFEFVPEYGYQLTGIAINETPLEAIKTVNQFEVEIPNANLHFAATFTKTEDVVKADSENVAGGSIELAKNSVEAGTVQLKVTDVVLEDTKIKGFEGAAQGAELKHFLDIDLYQVFYKGKANDTDVWSNQLEDLDGEAEITLQLGEDVDVENVVLVHNIHDGDEYEVIEIVRFDKEAHTITFRTKSFSNYAIATKPTANEVEITLKDSSTNVVIIFKDAEGHSYEDFDFKAIDITKLTDEQITELGIPKTEYEKGIEKIKKASEEYGGLVVLFNIQLSIPKEERDVTKGPFTLKIPYTDALKGYENTKLAYVDSEDFSLKDFVELKLEDGYLVGTLEHLSPYALVGKAITNNNGNNPSTGDNIVVFGSIFILSALAMGFEILIIKKCKK